MVNNKEIALDVHAEVVRVLEETLNLKGGTRMPVDAPLLGAVPELDSMEERFGFSVDDDEIDGTVFATVGSLVEFVHSKLGP